MWLQCQYCEVTLDNVKKYIFHLEVIHKILNYYVCPFNACNRTYNNKCSFKYHLNSIHLEDHSIDRSSIVSNSNENNIDNSTPESKPLYTTGSKNKQPEQHVPFTDAIKSHVEIFLCHLYDVVNLPRSLVQSIFEWVESLCKDIMFEINKSLNNSLLDIIDRIKEIQEITSFVNTVFKDLNTEHKRFKYFTSKDYYVPPKEIKLGTSTERQRGNNDMMLMTLKDSKLYLSSLRHVLKNFLELPNVFTEISTYHQQLLQEHSHSEYIIRNVVQASLWQELLATKSDEIITLPLILYFDDFESGNPLGSHAGQYKLGAVYVSIATIPPNKSSRLENVFLAQLFYSDDRSHFGNDLVFQNLLEELIFLEDVGITIDLSNKNVQVKFILVTLSGDNLGLHGLLGFFESFSATNFCRFCHTNKTDSQTQIQEINNLRQLADYENDVLNNVGIKAKCVWNKLPNFHAYNNLTCDVMHDLMEGVHRYGMARVVKGLIDKEYFSLNNLNSRIKYFKYHSSEKNVPPSINYQHLLNGVIIMSATEMLCFVRNFVFIVGDLVEPEEPIWLYYLTLLEITYILTSQAFTVDLLEYLKCLISEHHEQYQSVFQCTLKPKHHFLIHYPTIIKKIGPPILVSAFKYEAKHKDLKKVCQSITSRRDLPLSVFKRCLLKQTLRFVMKKGLVDNISHGKFDTFNDDSENQDLCNRLEINGVIFNVNDVILFNIIENIPEYYIISKIIYRSHSNELLFDCFYLQIVDYNAHFRAFKIVKTQLTKRVNYHDLYINMPSITYSVNGDLYVKLDF